MKLLVKALFIPGLAVFLLCLNGCKTNSSLNCPDLASSKKLHSPALAFNLLKMHQAKISKAAMQANNAKAAAPNQNTPVLASATSTMAFKIRMPNSLNRQLDSDKELDDMNKLLASYSDNKVALQRNDKGKLFLKAHSIKDIFALAKNTSQPHGYYERRYGSNGGGGDASGAAIASSILGPISFVFAFIPVLSFAAIPISIAAIITGAVGLRSHRHRMAAIGLTFGILGLIISLLMSWFYIAVFGVLLLL